MDNSRNPDLAALNQRFNDPTLSLAIRQRAYRAYQDIQAQVQDRTLVKLRYRLIGAHRANDEVEAGKLEKQIREHGWRKQRVLRHG